MYSSAILKTGGLALGALVLGELMVIVVSLVGVIGSRRTRSCSPAILGLPWSDAVLPKTPVTPSRASFFQDRKSRFWTQAFREVGLTWRAMLISRKSTAVVGDQLAEREGHGRGTPSSVMPSLLIVQVPYPHCSTQHNSSFTGVVFLQIADKCKPSDDVPTRYRS